MADCENDLLVMVLTIRGSGQRTFCLERILWGLGFRYVDNTMDVERDFLAVGGPVFVAEAVHIPPILSSLEGIVAGRHRVDLCFVRARRIGDLDIHG